MSNHPKRLKYYLLIVITIILINVNAINAQEVSPSPNPTPNSQFYDTPTNIKAAVIIMDTSKSWGIKIYPAIYAVQIVGIILRYV